MGHKELDTTEQLSFHFTSFLTEINTILPYNPAVILLGFLPNGSENLCPHKNLQKQMFIAALFIITKIWKQARCLSIGEWKAPLVAQW